MVLFKKLSKKSWADLGISDEEAKVITDHANEAGTFDFYVDHGGRVIDLIKEVRAFLGVDLVTAKNLVQSSDPILRDNDAKRVAQFNQILMDKGFNTETVHHGEARKVMPKVEVKSSVNTETAPLSKSQQARLMFEAKDWKALIQFKKAAKKGWDALGFNDNEIGQIKKATE